MFSDVIGYGKGQSKARRERMREQRRAVVSHQSNPLAHFPSASLPPGTCSTMRMHRRRPGRRDDKRAGHRGKLLRVPEPLRRGGRTGCTRRYWHWHPRWSALTPWELSQVHWHPRWSALTPWELSQVKVQHCEMAGGLLKRGAHECMGGRHRGGPTLHSSEETLPAGSCTHTTRVMRGRTRGGQSTPWP